MPIHIKMLLLAKIANKQKEIPQDNNMPFIPHTPDDVQHMLNTIGVNDIDDLFDEIPASLRCQNIDAIPSGLSEREVDKILRQRATQDTYQLCFAGGGAYEHYIPSAVWEITTRGEFYSAYTPYQAEASQGTLQLIYEYQTMMSSLTGMEVSNASLYDGASGLAEAVLMAVRANRKIKSRKLLVAGSVNPRYQKVVNNIVKNQNICLETLSYDIKQGNIDINSLPAIQDQYVALIIQQPNYFGQLEEVDTLTDWAQQHNMLVIAVVNPIALSILKPPGEWGTKGADIACGEGQPLGIPLSSGGPYFGFMTCKQSYVRQMPGRIVGATVDKQGKTGYTLTLQAREQHIRRSKATSNICTNQGLMVTAATIYLSLLGAAGLTAIAEQSMQNTRTLVSMLAEKNITCQFQGHYFHEIVVKLPCSAATVINALAQQNIIAGIDLSKTYPELPNTLLICVTETKSHQEIRHFVEQLHAATLIKVG